MHKFVLNEISMIESRSNIRYSISRNYIHHVQIDNTHARAYIYIYTLYSLNA